MRARPKNRRGKAAGKSTRKASRSKAARGKTARTKRKAARKTAKTPARRKSTRKSPVRRKSAAKKSAARKSTARKTTARKPARRSPPGARKDVFGEGNYTAAREFRRDETNFVRRNRNRIPALGEKAEQALEGPQGAELEEAENEARAHSHLPEGDM